MVVRGRADPWGMIIRLPHPSGIDFIDGRVLVLLEKEWIRSQLAGRRRTGWIVEGPEGIEVLRQGPAAEPRERDRRPRGSIASFRTEPDDGVAVEFAAVQSEDSLQQFLTN